jgi:RNA polymerase sigma factor (sigma-70 family)
MKKRRQIPAVERLEARETPDVSLHSAAYPLPPVAAKPAVASDLHGLPPQPLLAPEQHQQPEASLSGLEALLAQPGLPKHIRFSQAVRSLFANAEEVERLLASSATLLPEPPTSRPLAQATAPPQAVQFLTNYTRKAIRNAELKIGRLPDHEDIVHQAFVDWRERVGRGNQVFDNLLNRDSVERQVFRKSVRRAIDQARYERGRQARMVELQDQPAPANPERQEWIDLQLDWSLSAGRPGFRQRQVLELRRQGKTFEEIGAELGMIKQRVCEIFNSAIERLNQTYGPSKDRSRIKKSPPA